MKYLFYAKYGWCSCLCSFELFQERVIYNHQKRKDSLNDAFVEHVKGIFNVDVIRDHLFLSPERSYKEAIFTEAQW